MKISKTLKLITKVVLSILLIYYALRSVDFFLIISSLKSARPRLIGVAAALIAVGYLISALRWQILLKSQNITISLLDLVKMYLVGSFFNNFLPTTIGGDVVRTYDVSKVADSIPRSFAVIIVERLTGIFALICYAFLGVFLKGDRLGNIYLVWMTGGAFICILSGVILGTRFFGKIPPSEKGHKVLDPVRMKIFRVFNSLSYFKNKKNILQAVFLAFVLQFNVIIFYFFIAKALWLDPPFYYFLIIVPLAHVIFMFPISINGIGVRENVFILFLSKINIATASAIALSWISFALVLAYALIGGAIYAVRK